MLLWASHSPIKTNMAMHLGSCTKAMTASLICNLIDRSALSFDTKIRDVFAGQLHDVPSCDITIRQLLNHTAGVVDNMDWWTIDKMHSSSQRKLQLQRLEVVRLIMTDSKYTQLTTKSYQYSNVGYVVLGSVIETILNISWEEAMQSLIFTPLNMTRAGFGSPGVVSGHKPSMGMFYPTDKDNAAVVGPAGTVHCSVLDWSKFIAEILMLSRLALDLTSDCSGLKLGISVITFKELLSMSNPAIQYSGGWIIADRTWAKGYCLTHSGSNTAWKASVWIAPHLDTAYLVAINAGGTEASKMANDIITRLIHKSPPVKTGSSCSIQ